MALRERLLQCSPSSVLVVSSASLLAPSARLPRYVRATSRIPLFIVRIQGRGFRRKGPCDSLRAAPHRSQARGPWGFSLQDRGRRCAAKVFRLVPLLLLASQWAILAPAPPLRIVRRQGVATPRRRSARSLALALRLRFCRAPLQREKMFSAPPRRQSRFLASAMVTGRAGQCDAP